MRKWVLMRQDPTTGKIQYMTDAGGYGQFSDNIHNASRHDENRVLKSGLTRAKNRGSWGQKYDSNVGWVPDTTPWEYSVVEVEVKLDLLLNTQVKL